ncbi:MAG: hypothetical protein ACKV2V_02905 [Blastocatellia bacterium]
MNIESLRERLTRRTLWFSLLFLFVILPAQAAWAQGSVLFYNRYTSDETGADTRITMTNTSWYNSVTVHLFAVDGNTCSVADSFLTLGRGQSASFYASHYDPGVSGYLVAVATRNGLPVRHNYLTGVASIYDHGKYAQLSAVPAQRLSNAANVVNDGATDLLFNGVMYEKLPGAVALTSYSDPAETDLYLYSPAMDLRTGDDSTISVFGLIYGQYGGTLSTSTHIRCYMRVPLTGLRAVGGLPRNGWLRLSANRPLLGAGIGPYGGSNLTPLSYLSGKITIPVFAW